MLSTISRITSRRAWFVPRFSVWGSTQWCGVGYLTIEEIDGVKSVMFNSVAVGDASQTVNYEDLIDFRGNHLPTALKNPRVLVRPKSAETAFVVGEESDSGFKVATSSTDSGPVLVDLFIVEMGE